MGVSSFRLALYKEYYNWLRRTRKDSTCRVNIEQISRILPFFKSPYPTYDLVMEKVYSMQLDGKKGSYINHIIDCVKTYSHFLQETQKEYDPKIFELRYIKQETSEKATMSDEEIETFLALPPVEHMVPNNINGKLMRVVYGKGYSTWTLFFSILAFSGMRPTEVAHLEANDVDFGRNVFILRNTKTNDSRVVPIAKGLIEPLKTHILKHPDYLFPSTKGGNNNNFGKVFDSVDWGYNFNRRIERLGIKRRNLTVYSLRHSFITRLLGEDINIFKVQKIVGHKRIETTNGYTHLTTKDIQKAILKDPLCIRSNPQGKLEYLKEAIKGLVLDNVAGIRLTIDESPASFTFKAELEKA